METIKYTERYDFIVGTLYTLKTKGKYGYFSLKQIIQALDFPYNFDEIFQIGKYLEARGFVNAIFIIGDVQIEITPSGIIYWETANKETDSKWLQFSSSRK